MTYKKHEELIELALTIKHKTDKAFLVTDDDTEAWLPMSVIDWEEPDNVGCTTNFYLPEWLAEEKGFI